MDIRVAETHGQLGELNEGKHKFILQSLKELIQDQGERQQELRAKEDAADGLEVDVGFSLAVEIHSTPLRILCLPARTEADEIAAMMLAQVLEAKDCHVQSFAVESLAAEMSDFADLRAANVICLSATPPAAIMHARYLCRRLRSRLPKVNLVVGLWGAVGDLGKARERIGCGAIVVATLADAQEQIRLLVEPRLPKPEAQPEFGPMVLAGA